MAFFPRKRLGLQVYRQALLHRDKVRDWDILGIQPFWKEVGLGYHLVMTNSWPWLSHRFTELKNGWIFHDYVK